MLAKASQHRNAPHLLHDPVKDQCAHRGDDSAGSDSGGHAAGKWPLQDYLVHGIRDHQMVAVDASRRDGVKHATNLAASQAGKCNDFGHGVGKSVKRHQLNCP